jgi:hypothetical protein
LWLTSGSFTHKRFSLVPSLKLKIVFRQAGAFLYFECHDIGSYADPSSRYIASETCLAGTIHHRDSDWCSTTWPAVPPPGSTPIPTTAPAPAARDDSSQEDLRPRADPPRRVAPARRWRIAALLALSANGEGIPMSSTMCPDCAPTLARVRAPERRLGRACSGRASVSHDALSLLPFAQSSTSLATKLGC